MVFERIITIIRYGFSLNQRDIAFQKHAPTIVRRPQKTNNPLPDKSSRGLRTELSAIELADVDFLRDAFLRHEQP